MVIITIFSKWQKGEIVRNTFKEWHNRFFRPINSLLNKFKCANIPDGLKVIPDDIRKVT